MKHLDTIAAATLFTALSLAIGCGGSSDSGTNADAGAGNGNGTGSGADASVGTDGNTNGRDASAPRPAFDGGTACGQTACDPVNEDCCLDTTGGTCVTKGGSCSGVAIACQSPSDCTGGKVCCASFSGTASITCVDSCDPSTGRQLCNTDADCTSPDTCISIGPIKYCGQPFMTPDGGTTPPPPPVADAAAHD